MKHSARSRNSEHDNLALALLDLLADAPSSFAGLYHSAVTNLGFSRSAPIRQVADALAELEQDGYVSVWLTKDNTEPREPSAWEREEAVLEYEKYLPAAELRDLAVDEIGLWYEMTAAGREHWSDSGPTDQAGRWTIDESTDQSTANRLVTIKAEDRRTAEDLLHRWARYHPEWKLDRQSIAVNAPTTFELADGKVIKNGVELTCRLVKPDGQD